MTTAAVNAGVSMCHVLPLLEEEGGDTDGLSFSLASLSSVGGGTADGLRGAEREMHHFFQ